MKIGLDIKIKELKYSDSYKDVMFDNSDYIEFSPYTQYMFCTELPCIGKCGSCGGCGSCAACGCGQCSSCGCKSMTPLERKLNKNQIRVHFIIFLIFYSNKVYPDHNFGRRELFQQHSENCN